MKIALGQAKENARLGLRPIQVCGRQSTAQYHVAVTPVLDPANVLLARLVLRLPGQSQAKPGTAQQAEYDGATDFMAPRPETKDVRYSALSRLMEF